MHRILVIVLLAFLPLQFSWSAVADYCEHETQVGTEHLGHHDHEHHGDSDFRTDTGTAAAEEAPAAFDLDCGHCHGHCAGMPPVQCGEPVRLSAAPPAALIHAAGGAHAPSRPERPQWASLA